MQKADAACVQTARFGFKRLNNLHTHAFWRAGNTAARECCMKNIGNRNIRQRLRLDGTGHLPNTAKTGNFKRFRHAYFARLCDFAEIVAQQIDNHHIFGAVFRIVLQFNGAAFILSIMKNRRSTFHRLGCDQAV